MNWSGIYARSNQELGTVTVLPRGDYDKLCFFGATFPADARNGDLVSSLTLAPEKGQFGIAAVGFGGYEKIAGNRRANYSWYYVLLAVDFDGEEPRVCTTGPWQCYSKRLGSIGEHGVISVKIDGAVYSNSPHNNPKGQLDNYVPDTELLLRFIAGDTAVGSKEVKAAVKEREPAKKTVTEEEMLSRLQELANSHNRQMAEVERQCDQFKMDATRKEKGLSELRGSTEELLSEICTALQSQWFKSGRLRKILARLTQRNVGS